MSADDQLWTLVEGLEQQLPLQQDRLEAFFGATFETRKNHNKRPILVSRTARYEVEVHPPSGAFQGDMTVRFTSPLTVDPNAVVKRFPGGHSLPPPPPGYGPADAQGAYVADRPWGQIWFAFYTGNRLFQLSISPGLRGSPGV